VADLAGTTTLTAELSAALDGVRGPQPRHDPGRVLVDLAVAIADGAEAISDIAVLADQPALFGSVASDSTCWRLLDALGDPELAAVAAARARAREVAWAQRAETTGTAFGPSRVAGTAGVEALVIDLDGHIVVCHSEKEQAAPTFKHTFGYHPVLAFCDNTGEFLAATLRPGNAGSNTAADPTSRCWTRHWRRTPTRTGMGARSWSGPTAPAAPRRSSPTSAACAITAQPPSSRSGGPSPPGSPPPSAYSGSGTGLRRSTPTASLARSSRRPSPSSPGSSRADLGGLSGRHPGDRAPRTPAPGAQLDLIEETDTALAIDT
jgi:hypothetical protein